MTGDKALQVLREGQELCARFKAATSLKAAALDKEVTQLKQVSAFPHLQLYLHIHIADYIAHAQAKKVFL